MTLLAPVLDKIVKENDIKLAKVDVDEIDECSPVVLKFNIPFEMNYFSCDDNDPFDVKTRQNDCKDKGIDVQARLH